MADEARLSNLPSMPGNGPVVVIERPSNPSREKNVISPAAGSAVAARASAINDFMGIFLRGKGARTG
jgi:hypothetical protein